MVFVLFHLKREGQGERIEIKERREEEKVVNRV